MSTISYEEFLAVKAQSGLDGGFEPIWMPDCLFDFQEALTRWTIRKGRAAEFADCGLGKTLMQLVWAENVARRTNGRVLIITPVAVSAQTIGEGDKFGIDVRRSGDGSLPKFEKLVVTNYERLHYFNRNDFVGVVCDESSILKNFDGIRKAQITDFMRHMEYRMLATATAAPNDFIELGTSSEALGYLGYMDMLNRFFKNDLGNSSTGRGYLGKQNAWRFKGHAEQPFWRWVCSWARAVRKPSDLGFDDGRFQLPPLVEREHLVKANTLADGMLFAMPAADLQQQREDRRRTLNERCEKAAELTADTRAPFLAWCDLNAEGDVLENLMPDAVQVAGSDSDEAKEEKFLAFARGEVRGLITKKVIGAWGLNFQHCAHEIYFPSHSFEQYYQAVRRCWRFGQSKPVTVDIIATEGERGVMANLQRKAASAERMFASLVAHMNEQLHIDRGVAFSAPEEVPAWL